MLLRRQIQFSQFSQCFSLNTLKVLSHIKLIYKTLKGREKSDWLGISKSRELHRRCLHFCLAVTLRIPHLEQKIPAVQKQPQVQNKTICSLWPKNQGRRSLVKQNVQLIKALLQPKTTHEYCIPTFIHASKLQVKSQTSNLTRQPPVPTEH